MMEKEKGREGCLGFIHIMRREERGERREERRREERGERREERGERREERERESEWRSTGFLRGKCNKETIGHDRGNSTRRPVASIPWKTPRWVPATA
jgi:hypothetical protein